jgi:two-component system chemotaxis family response regulator WspR
VTNNSDDSETETGPPDFDESIRVLLIDDQAIVGESVRRLLANEPNISFRYSADPNQAIQQAKETQATVILQDLVMPQIDGLDLVRRFRADTEVARIPIIVLSSKEDSAVKSQAFAAGADDYLVKLPDKIELVARIRHHSSAYLNQIQRDEAYRALRESQQQFVESNKSLVALNQKLEEANRTISELARTDSLTGLTNRRVFEEELNREVQRATRKERHLTALILDLDHFKSVNDTYGHGMGDTVLKTAGKFLAGQMRPYDLVSRYGGEEFVILLPETELAGGVCVADRLRTGLSAVTVDGYPHPLTASFGVAALLTNELPLHLVERADAALYLAKRKGRNRVESAPDH